MALQPVTTFGATDKDRRHLNATGHPAKLNGKAKDSDIGGLFEFALPLQRADVETVGDHALRLTAGEDPSEPA